MTEPTYPPETRWQPDMLLIPALLAGSPTTWNDLTPADRAWVVAGMRRDGMTAEQIRQRLVCALRTVRSMMAEPMTAVCRLLQEESEHFADELRMTRDELRRMAVEMTATAAARDRYREQLFTLLDAHLTEGGVGTFPCGCPRTKYNTYTAPKTGKQGCREHRSAAVRRCRERQSQAKAAGVKPVIDCLPASAPMMSTFRDGDVAAPAACSTEPVN